jgi:hypothetical protein
MTQKRTPAAERRQETETTCVGLHRRVWGELAGYGLLLDSKEG